MGPELRRRMEPCDATHEAYLKALRSQKALEGETRPEVDAWFSRVLRHTVRDLVRALRAQRRGGAQEVILSLSQLLEAITKGLPVADREPTSPAPSPDVMLSNEEQFLSVVRCLVALEDMTYRLVFLVAVLEHPISMAAEELGLNLIAASSRLCRARGQLLTTLRQKGFRV